MDTATEHPTIFDASTCVRKGLCPVTQLRGQEGQALESHSLYFEQHGKGSKFKYIFIMGLNSSSFAWSAQVTHFAKQEDSTMLVFDNRGVGNSEYPRGPYTTSGMAEDVICLLDYLDWTEKRSINIIGISLGGMIAQELAYRIPERIVSLTLAVTTPGGYPWNNLPPWSGVRSLARLMVTSENEKKVPIVLPMLFPTKWLAERDEDDAQSRTNYDVQTENFLRRVTITKPQQFIGHISQMSAGLTHYVSPERLRIISASIPKVTIVTGDVDNLVRPSGSYRLKEAMPEAELVQWKNTGHGLHTQRVKEFNALVEKTAREGKARVDDGWMAIPV
ncbi:Alpha/Beta hydrolase protein [Cyathus striatus]|nr:Alpha/Beta hydrolase protein [Cyathus striatus]